MKTLFTAVISLLSLTVMAQQSAKKSVVIGSMTTRPNALLIVNPPDSDQGILLPQLSTGQRMSLKPSSPSEDGLMVFDTNFQSYYYWSSGAWSKLDASTNKRSMFYSIDPLDFRGLNPNTLTSQNNLAVFETDNAFVTARRDGMGEEIMAPVGLPHGAVIKELTLYYMDNDIDNLKIYLFRKSLSGGNENILSWESSGTTPSIRNESFTNFNGMETIDRENFTYRLHIVFDIHPEDIIDQPSDARQRIYAVKIKYQP